MSRVAVLAGGRSHEREVSLRSGHRVVAALEARDHDPVLVDPAEMPLVETLANGAFDVCAIALHGKDGEDGTVQRLLETLAVPYTGTGPLACHVAFDKILAKETLRAHGIFTPPWAAVQASALRDLSAGAILSAVVEAKVEGTEIAAGIIGAPPDVLPLVEIVPKSGIYDYASRYTSGATEYFAPARLEAGVASEAASTAASAFGALELRDVARADLIVDAKGRSHVLEVNVSPGMTETSLLPMAAHAAGMELSDLWDRLVRLAIERRAGARD